MICLEGSLGAGKTVFARGFARGMGIDEPITSPTYALIQEYAGALDFIHMDLYRIHDSDDAMSLGLEEYWDRGVCLVEWASRAAPLLPAVHLEVEISVLADGATRRIEFRAPPALEALLTPFWKEIHPHDHSGL